MRPGFQWYHLLATTYGAWLYGDARGFRTRHHREHVEGDYKNPPPAGTYAAKESRSKGSLRRQKVIIPESLRPVLGRALLEKLQKLGARVVCISVSAKHIHILAETEARVARRWMGLAKKHGWFVLREHGW